MVVFHGVSPVNKESAYIKVTYSLSTPSIAHTFEANRF